MRRLHHHDAERAILCSVILGGDAVLDRLLLEADEFYDLRSRAVFDAMRRLRSAGKPVGDLQMLESELGDKLEAVGGLAYLSELVVQSATPDNVEQYQSLVRRAALTRRTITALAELQTSELEGTELVGRVLEVTARLAEFTEDPAVPIGVAVREAFTALAEARGRDQTWGLTTGFPDLDKAIGGIQYGVVTICAGRPSMGKSALARSIANNANLYGGVGVHVFTPEDSRQTYALRQLADDAKVPLEKIRALTVSKGEFSSIQRAAGELWKRRQWLIDDTSGLSSQDVAMRVRKHRRENQTRLVVVDYAQLLREPGIGLADKRMQVEIAAENLVSLARSENLAVLLLSQLSRECERREDKRPLLSDLRESGALEQVAEAVLCVYREEMYDADTEDRGITEVIVRKNKNGQTGTVRLQWDGPTATHRPLYRRAEQQEMYQ